MTTTSNTVATATPIAPKSRDATTPTSVAATSWQTSTSSRIGARKRSGSSTRRRSDRAPRWPASSSDLARARGGPGEAGLGEREHGRHGDQDEDRDRAAPPSAPVKLRSAASITGRAGAVVGREQLLLERLHRRRLAVVVVVHAEQVQDPVHEQEGELVLVGAGVARVRAARRPPGR